MKPSRYRFVLCALLILAAPLTWSDDRPSESAIQKILADRIDNAGQSVGIVVGWIDKDGRVVVGHGLTGADETTAPDGDTVFEIGSVTKVFTGILLAEMAARDEVDPADHAQAHLPEAVQLPVAEGGEPITLRHLATHTSGLPRMPSNFAPADPTNPYADYSVEQFYEFISGHDPERVAGAVAEYSNLGTGLLGHILALRADVEFEELVRERITGPLGMKDTAIALTPKMEKRLAVGHDANLNPVANWDIPTLAGAGALRSTVNDMLTFAAANLGLKETKLAAVLKDAMTPREPFGSEDVDVGFGWITTRAHDRSITWHNGGTGGYHSFIGLDLERGRGVVVLSNANPSIDDIGFHLLEPQFELADLTPPETVDEIPDSPAGKALVAWLEAILADGTEAASAHYEAAFDDSFKGSVPLDTYLGIRGQLLGLLQSGVSKVAVGSEYDLTGYVEAGGSWFAIQIQVSPEGPHRIVGLLVQPSSEPD